MNGGKRMAKKVIYILALLTAVCCSVCSCSSKELNVMSTNIDSFFTDAPSISSVLEDIEKVDVFRNPEIDGTYESASARDENSGADTVRYYKDDILVYTVYTGIGEERFEYHTQSLSGGDMTVTYADTDGKRSSVIADCVFMNGSGYSVNFGNNLSRDKKYGSDRLTVTVNVAETNGLPVYAEYSVMIDGDKTSAVMISARYFDDDGNYRTYSGGMNSRDRSDTVLYGKEEGNLGIGGNPEAAKSLKSAGAVSVQIVLTESNKFSWSFDENGSRIWYINAKIRALFDSKDARDAYAKANGGESGMYTDGDGSGESSTYYYWAENAILRLSGCASFGQSVNLYDFITSEITDTCTYTVTFTDDGIGIASMR